MKFREDGQFGGGGASRLIFFLAAGLFLAAILQSATCFAQSGTFDSGTHVLPEILVNSGDSLNIGGTANVRGLNDDVYYWQNWNYGTLSVKGWATLVLEGSHDARFDNWGTVSVDGAATLALEGGQDTYQQTTFVTNGTLAINGLATLAVEGGQNAKFYKGGGGLTVDGEATLAVKGENAEFNHSYGTLTVDGEATLTVEGSQNAEFINGDGAAATLTLDGSATLVVKSGQDALFIHRGGYMTSLTVDGMSIGTPIPLTVDGSATLAVEGGENAEFYNYGLLTVDGAATLAVKGGENAEFYNYGLLTVDGAATLAVKGDGTANFENYETLTVGGEATLTVEGETAKFGHGTSTDAFARLTIDGSATLLVKGQDVEFCNFGTLTIDGDATLSLESETAYFNDYQELIANGSTTLSSKGETAYISIDRTMMSIPLSLEGLSAKFENNGWLTVDGATTLAVKGQYAKFDNNDRLDVYGSATLAVEGQCFANVYNAGSLVVAKEATLTVKGQYCANFYNDSEGGLGVDGLLAVEGQTACLRNDGRITVYGSLVLKGGQYVEIRNSGTMTVYETATLALEGGLDTGFYNHGTMIVDGSATLAMKSGETAYFISGETLAINKGATLSLEGQDAYFSNDGKVTIDGALVLKGGEWAELISEGGDVTINGSATLSLEAEITHIRNISGPMTINDNQINVDGMGNNDGTLVLNNSSLEVYNLVNFGEWDGDDNYYVFYGLETPNTAIELDNSTIRIKYIAGVGTEFFRGGLAFLGGSLKLSNGSSFIVESGGIAVFDAGSHFLIAGKNNIIKADELLGVSHDYLYDVLYGDFYGNPLYDDYHATASTTTFRVEGTDSATDFVDIDAKISFVASGDLIPDLGPWEYDYPSTQGSLDFRNVEAKLSSAVYTNVNEAYFRNAIVSGNGASHVDFFFYGNGSGVKPGNSIGTFYGNNFTLSSSTVYIEVGSKDFDKIIASGKIEFLGNTNVVLLDYGNAGDSFTMNFSGKDGIFQAAKGIFVGGDALAQTNATTDTANNEIQITGTNGSVVLQSDDFTFTGVRFENGDIVFNVGGGGAPKSSVSNDVQTLTSAVTEMQLQGGNGLTKIVAVYAGLSRDYFVAALNELNPVPLSLSEIFIQNAIASFNRTNYDRLLALQSRDHFNDGVHRGCEVWFQQVGNLAIQEKTDVNGYISSTYSLTLGADGRVSNDTVLGVGFSGSFARASMYDRLGNAKADSFLLSLYGSHKIDQWTVSGTIGGTFSNLESNRYAPKFGENAKGERGATTFFTGVELARRFGDRDACLTPFIAYDYVNYSEDAFQETGDLINMNVARKNVTGLRQTFGFRFGWEIGAVQSELTAGWLHDYGVGTVRTAGSFVVDDTVPFIVDGVSRNNDRALIGVKQTLVLSPRAHLFSRVDGEWAKSYTALSLVAGFGFGF